METEVSWNWLETAVSVILLRFGFRLVGLSKVGTVQQSSCTGLPFVQVQWTKCPKTVRETGGLVQESWCTVHCKLKSGKFVNYFPTFAEKKAFVRYLGKRFPKFSENSFWKVGNNISLIPDKLFLIPGIVFRLFWWWKLFPWMSEKLFNILGLLFRLSRR